ncbi:MAG: zinc ABC transporter substrate-binding protein [Planctomycetes bacterium]|nr:zinc ABC transporter substrate-binding protein [Planctomycetota bacterium]
MLRPVPILSSLAGILMAAAGSCATACAQSPSPVLQVVATLPDYAFVARRIGGERVRVSAIVQGDQDAHFIRPKPSFVTLVARADVLIGTGLDLELWLPTVIDRSGNRRVRSGQPGFVAASHGVGLREKPAQLSRIEGGVHVYGNPHITSSPLNLRIAAHNIARGLCRNDEAGTPVYEAGLRAFVAELDERLFGAELVKLLGGDTLAQLATKGTLLEFLGKNRFRGQPLLDSLGGWLGRMRPLRGTRLVTYHKNWVYFLELFGLEEAGTVEPKPGISPTPGHVTGLVERMREQGIKILLAANYFDRQQVHTVAERVGAAPVIVPLYVGGAPGAEDYFALVDLWIDGLLGAARRTGILAGE